MQSDQIDRDACRGRQQRLLAAMRRRSIDLAIVTQAEHVQWLTGWRTAWVFQSAAALSSDGKLTLVVPNRAPDAVAADEVVTYAAQRLSTLRNDQSKACAEILCKSLASHPRPRRMGSEFSSCPHHLSLAMQAELVDIEPDLYELRRRKDPDEVATIRRTIAGTCRMYEKARAILEPGITELEVFNQLQAAAVEEFGEMLTRTGNDYQCGSRGGPPRAGRKAQAGELYILDLGPSFRGYFADNCRTIAVSEASDVQHEAWMHLLRVFDHVQRTVRPGKSARELFFEAKQILDAAPVGVFDHHLGHGFGLFPHEAPHLNPNWDDVFQDGEVFAVEPGLYAPELKAGLRIEHNYLVTQDGVELLTDFSVEL